MAGKVMLDAAATAPAAHTILQGQGSVKAAGPRVLSERHGVQYEMRSPQVTLYLIFPLYKWIFFFPSEKLFVTSQAGKISLFYFISPLSKICSAFTTFRCKLNEARKGLFPQMPPFLPDSHLFLVSQRLAAHCL